MKALLAAEQAVLGAVLLEPEQLARLEWLAPDHFYRPIHAALFAALRKLRTDGHPATTAHGTVPLSWVTDAVTEAGQRVRGLNTAYAHILVTACPRPAHAPVYGRMVLEGAIHRSVTAHAIRLHQIARADAVQGEARDTLYYADVLAGVLTDLAHRWGSDPQSAAPAMPTTTSPDGSPAAAGRAVEEEELLLAVLVDRPGAMDEVVDWLRPEDFADLAHRHLYRCLGALHHRGGPIDRIIVLWEAQHRGLLTNGALSTERVNAICDALGPGSAAWLGEHVIRSSLTRTAAVSARTIQALAEDATLAPGPLISHALHVLGQLDQVRARWRTAHGEATPTAPARAPARDPAPARTHAALSRSTPHRLAHSPQPPRPTASPAVRPSPHPRTRS